MKRAISLLVVVLMLTSLFGGCGQTSGTTATTSAQVTKSTDSTTKEASTTQPEKKLEGKITFATNRTDKADNVLTDLAKEFMQKYPDTQVEVEGLKDPGTVLKTRMAANEIPDITLVLDDTSVNDYPLYFAPLDDIGFSKDNTYFYDAGLGPDNKLYKSTCAISFDGIAYNKKVFKDCGIDKIPTTLGELYAACEKIKAKGIIPVATNFKDSWPLYWYTFFFAEVNTGNPNYTNELAKKDKLYSDDGGLLEGLKILRTLKDKGYVEPDLMSTNWDGFKRDMAQGKIAMAFIGPWIDNQIVGNGGKVEDLGCFPFPFPGTKAIQLRQDAFYGISKNSKYLDTAKEFYKFLFKDGRFAKSVDVIPPIKGYTIEDPFAKEVMSYNVPVVEAVPLSKDTDFNAIYNKAQMDLARIAQEYLIANNPDDVAKKYNSLWAETKKTMGK